MGRRRRIPYSPYRSLLVPCRILRDDLRRNYPDHFIRTLPTPTSSLLWRHTKWCYLPLLVPEAYPSWSMILKNSEAFRSIINLQSGQCLVKCWLEVDKGFLDRGLLFPCRSEPEWCDPRTTMRENQREQGIWWSYCTFPVESKLHKDYRSGRCIISCVRN
jgi:hypothetical protein